MNRDGVDKHELELDLEWHLDRAETEYACGIFSVEARSMHRGQTAPPTPPTQTPPTQTTPTQTTPKTHEHGHEHGPTQAVFHVIQCADWVNIVALTDDDAIVLIRQWRAGVARTTLEIPGGMMDPHEAPLEAAIRELREETGFEANDWQVIGVVEPNPAIQSNRCHTFVARGARRVHAPDFDPTEHCVTEVVPFSEVSNLVRDGSITHALVIAALHFETLRRTRQSTP
ncbi:MAG: NUDIX hydrolase [Deltaproteobacteria bacterium]|nr:NUDIX hydrolase [Deltaproteobacteria bacterium]